MLKKKDILYQVWRDGRDGEDRYQSVDSALRQLEDITITKTAEILRRFGLGQSRYYKQKIEEYIKQLHLEES